MGLCASRKKKYIYDYEIYNNNNIYECILENNIDNIITGKLDINIDNIIKGRLHINNKKCFYTTIYFYKNYLYIVNKKFKKIINYDKILCWSSNLNNLWISFKIIEDEKEFLYKLYLYKNKDNKNMFNKIKICLIK